MEDTEPPVRSGVTEVKASYGEALRVIGTQDKNGNHIGQCQQWFFFVARAPDVEPTPDNAEFGAWRWIAPAELAEIVVEFRRPSYRLALGLP